MGFWGFTIQIIGELLIAFTVLRVHQKILTEKKINKKVENDIKLEQVAGILGVICITVGYLMQVI